MAGEEFDEADAVAAPDPERTFEEHVVPQDSKIVKRGKPKKWKHNATTRRWMAFSIVGVSLALYGYLTVAAVYGLIDSDEYRGYIASLAPLQALAAATVGFFFGRQSGD